MSDEVVKEAPQSTQGGRSGKRGSRLPPRKPLVKKKKAVPAKGRAAQGARRGNRFTQNETESLLELLEDHLPLAKEEWEKISRLHELRYPQQKRNTDSIRRKISALCRTVPLTGDPAIPPDVLKAKEIRRAMTERADIGEHDDSEDDYTEEMNDEIISVPAPGTPPTSGSAASIIPETTHGVTEERFLAGTNPVAMQRANPSPRPLVRKISGTNVTDDDSIMGVLKASILQEQMRKEEGFRQRMLDKEEESKRREEERYAREQERLDDRERRAKERQRSDRMMQMMFAAILGARTNGLSPDNNNPSK